METNISDDTHTFHFTIFADYHQVHLEDCRLAVELDQRFGEIPVEYVAQIDAYVANVLSPEAHSRQLGVAHRTPCLLTAMSLCPSLSSFARTRRVTPSPTRITLWRRSWRCSPAA